MGIFLKKKNFLILVLFLQGMVLFLFSLRIIIGFSVPPAQNIKMTVLDNKALFTFDASDRVYKQMGQLGKDIGINDTSWVNGFEVGIDSSTSAFLRNVDYKNYTFEMGEKYLKFKTVEKVNSGRQKDLWEWGKYLPESSNLYYFGSKNDKWIQKIPSWNKQQNEWFLEIISLIDDDISVGVIREENLPVPTIIGKTSKTEEVKKVLEKLQDMDFDREGGVIGYSEKQLDGVKLYLTFIDGTVFKNFIILTFSPNVLEKEIKVLQGTERNLTENPYFLETKKEFADNGSYALFVQNPSQLLEASDEGIFKFSFKESEVNTIFNKLSYLAVVQSNGFLKGKIVAF